MFPSGLYPSSVFPASLFPGAGKTGAGPVISNPFEIDLLAYLAGLNLTVYPGKIPQGIALPACFFALISEEPYFTLKSAAGLTAKTYQFSTLSTRFADTVTLERSIRAVLNGFRGLMGTSVVSSCRLQSVLDLPYETNVDGSDDGTYHRATEYRVLVKESIPTFS